MRTVEIQASRPYRVNIGSGLLDKLGETVRSVTKAGKVCIVSDSNVWALYGQRAEDALLRAGLATFSFVFAPGEEQKNGETYMALLNRLAQQQMTRSDCIAALGGGVVGDLAGFAAATYLRGIDYIQVPTSLLAMVDSSVGGKTAINLPAGKNLAGAFWQPAAVLCDTDTLATLPDGVFRDGCAEVIKYGLLFDEALIAQLEAEGLNFDQTEVISRCISHKQLVVASDEFDKGARMLLNLGHTIGHAIEKCSNFTVSHGHAVAMGIACVCRSTKCPNTARILSLLEAFGLPVTIPFAPEALAAAALSDKKRSASLIDLIIPKAIGHCVIEATPVEQLQTLIQEGI